jgi:hypothetical protein
MPSAIILSELSYSAVLLAKQPIHQRFVLSGPLVLGKSPLKQRRPQQIGDQPVSRMFILPQVKLSQEDYHVLLRALDYNFIPISREANV